MEQLDETLLEQVGRRERGGSLPMLELNERIAVNLLWRKGVHVSVLMEVFKIGKNTIYANCLTGGGAYATGHRAIEVNEIIDRMGENEAYKKYVTQAMIRAVNAANRELAERKSAA
jgi:hypothetical protein